MMYDLTFVDADIIHYWLKSGDCVRNYMSYFLWILNGPFSHKDRQDFNNLVAIILSILDD
jgi:hypothetical protein